MRFYANLAKCFITATPQDIIGQLVLIIEINETQRKFNSVQSITTKYLICSLLKTLNLSDDVVFKIKYFLFYCFGKQNLLLILLFSK